MAQREERAVPVSVPSSDIVLDALFVAGERGSLDGESGAVIAPPHPLYGGSMESPVVTEIAFAFAAAGRARSP